MKKIRFDEVTAAVNGLKLEVDTYMQWLIENPGAVERPAIQFYAIGGLAMGISGLEEAISVLKESLG